jgi:hypothetical protein
VSTKRELELELERAQTGGYDVRIALPVLLLIGLIAAGEVPAVAGQIGHGFSPLWTTLLAFPLMWVGWRLGPTLWPREVYGHAPETEWHYLIVVTGVASAVVLPCIGYLGLAPVFWPLVGGVAVFALLLAGICLGAPGHAARVARHDVESYRSEVDAMWRAIFDDSDLRAIDISERREWTSGAGFTLVCEPHPEAARRATFAQFRDALPALVANADYRMKRHDGTRIRGECLIAEAGTGGSEYLLHVRTKDVFSRSVPYQIRTTPGDIRDGLPDVGLAQDGEVVNMAGADTHGKVVGRTGSGKSNLTNVMIGRTTQASNALVWICASTKLIPLVFPWLLPWFLGRTDWPVIDYIAGQSRKRILMMLRNGYLIADERNRRNTRRSKRVPTEQEPAIVIYFDEASDAVEDDRTVITCHDGIKRNISSLLYAITRVGRSVNVSVRILTQVGLVSAMGSHGTELMRNLVERVCLRTMSHHDGPATLPALPATVDASMLLDFTAYIQPSTEVPRAIPWKAYELDGDEQIVPVAMANTAWKPELEHHSAVWNEPGYHDRWHPESLPELFDAVEFDEDGLGTTWPYRPDLDGDHEDEPEISYDPAAAAASVDREEAIAAAEHGEGRDDVDRELDEIIAEGRDTEEVRTVDTARQTAPDDGLFDGPVTGPDATVTDGADPFGEFRAEADATLAKLADINARMRAEADAAEARRRVPPETPAETTGPVHTPRPVPSPLREVIEWLDRTDYALDQVRTGMLAAGIGRDDTPEAAAQLGRELSDLGCPRTTNVRRDIDARQRKGYAVRDLRERAARIRFGL